VFANCFIISLMCLRGLKAGKFERDGPGLVLAAACLLHHWLAGCMMSMDPGPHSFIVISLKEGTH
jgi:hypothetical protein